MRFPPKGKDTELHLAKIQVNYELSGKLTPVSLLLSVFLYRQVYMHI